MIKAVLSTPLINLVDQRSGKNILMNVLPPRVRFFDQLFFINQVDEQITWFINPFGSDCLRVSNDYFDQPPLLVNQ